MKGLRDSLSNLGFLCPLGTPLPELLLDVLEKPAAGNSLLKNPPPPPKKKKTKDSSLQL